MPNANVQFKRGLLANMPSSVIDGTIYITTDEHAMYVDNGNQRIRIGDFIPVNTVNDLPAAGHVYETAVYYVKTGNILARWDKTNSRWIQINKAGVVGVRQNGNSGNVITDITIDTAADGTLQLVVTKATVATLQQLNDLIDRVEAAESDIDDLESTMDTLTGDVNTQGSILNLIQAATDAILGDATTYTTLGDIEDAIVSISSSLAGVSNRVTTVEDTLDNYGPRITANENAITTLNGDATVTGSVSQKVAAAIADIVANAPASFDTLKEIADWISTHGSDAATMQSNIASLTTNVNGLRDRMDTAESDISALEARMDTAEGNITDLQDDVNTLNGSDSTPGSVGYKIDQKLVPISNKLNTAYDNAAEAIDRLTWQEFPVSGGGSSGGGSSDSGESGGGGE